MIDRDLAELFRVDTKALNQSVKRNIERFPESYRFQLQSGEKEQLVTKCDRFTSLKHSSTLPHAFTEHGVAMLSAVLRGPMAVKMSLLIIDAFVSMRRLMDSHSLVSNRLSAVELKQFELEQKFDTLFGAFDKDSVELRQGIFFDGQVFDAYTFVSDLFRSAKTSIHVIDNYINESVLLLLSKRNYGVAATIYTKTISKELIQDIDAHNKQYAPIAVHRFDKSHDRFIIVDKLKVYHIGASLKDLGKKWFAFSILSIDSLDILNRISSK